MTGSNVPLLPSNVSAPPPPPPPSLITGGELLLLHCTACSVTLSYAASAACLQLLATVAALQIRSDHYRPQGLTALDRRLTTRPSQPGGQGANADPPPLPILQAPAAACWCCKRGGAYSSRQPGLGRRHQRRRRLRSGTCHLTQGLLRLMVSPEFTSSVSLRCVLACVELRA
jgi:hypothetical protein